MLSFETIEKHEKLSSEMFTKI